MLLHGVSLLLLLLTLLLERLGAVGAECGGGWPRRRLIGQHAQQVCLLLQELLVRCIHVHAACMLLGRTLRLLLLLFLLLLLRGPYPSH